MRDKNTGLGFCRAPQTAVISRAAPHFGEEPCISGTRGSGAVFFCGCNLRCVFCQNAQISRNANEGIEVSPAELAEIFSNLESLGVHNINLVTPSHYTRAIREALLISRPELPVVYNSSGYDSVAELKKLEGLVDIYMPDLKYMDPALSSKYSLAPDYPKIAIDAIQEMYRQIGPFVLDGDGIMKKGVIIRHLMLPSHLEDTFNVIDKIAQMFPYGEVMFSLMAQYTPLDHIKGFCELERGITQEEYGRAVDYLEFSGISSGFIQELSSCGKEMIPAFDGTGVLKNDLKEA